MEQPPVRFFVAGILVAAVFVFAVSFRNGLASHRAQALAVPVTDAAAEAAARPEVVSSRQPEAESTDKSVGAVPAAKPQKTETEAKPVSTFTVAEGERFIYPLSGAPISSYFGLRWGRQHKGVDFAANTGTPIKAASSGRVILAGPYSTYGNAVVLEHPGGQRTLYAHCSVVQVQVGQTVKQGQVIAQVGSTGHSTGPHLHFEVFVNDVQVDPMLYLPKR